MVTPVSEVMARRRGVCQDFAHLEIACLRSLGLPARYVSGHVETGPGAGASHAWCAVAQELVPVNPILAIIVAT